ncbi:unnamed protein product [Cuscuta campestris]|uniref:Uncharacterized protein n=1 Tax=Cuscuta campestris TaxID=132261 RepID=A0A484NUQ8_9ASTE|nr:unnamed protein product [Cuscuta campestris]
MRNLNDTPTVPVFSSTFPFWDVLVYSSTFLLRKIKNDIVTLLPSITYPFSLSHSPWDLTITTPRHNLFIPFSSSFLFQLFNSFKNPSTFVFFYRHQHVQ